MPGFVVTRGLGPGATTTNLIVRGFLPASVTAAVEAVRGAVRRGRKAKQQFEDLLEELKVTAMLVAINGKDLVKPIINTVRTSYKDEPTPEIQVTPTKLAVRQPDIKVKVTHVRNKDVDNRIDD
tara:strand:- start:2355 stop:2726 length:372 start_codon:yes stop_codon:yes gene_type:complete